MKRIYVIIILLSAIFVFGSNRPAWAKVTIWDANKKYKGKYYNLVALPDKAKWTQVPYGSTDYTFKGDAIVENEHLWLFLHSNNDDDIFLYGKINGKPTHENELYTFSKDESVEHGTDHIKILKNESDEVVIEHGARERHKGAMIIVSYRILSGKHWVGMRSVENATRKGIHGESHLMVVPNDSGNDYVCDSLKEKPRSVVPVPEGRMVIDLIGAGNFMWTLTYPSPDQAGDFFISSTSDAVEHHGERILPCINSANAKFDGKSLCVGVINSQDSWHYEKIDKLIRAGDTYAVSWKQKYPGRWRLTACVDGKYYSRDVIDGQFTYTAKVGGTLEYLIMYLYDRTKDTPKELATPMDVYRDCLSADK